MKPRFTTSCFIRIDNPMKRYDIIDKLKCFGYKVAHFFSWEKVILVENDHIQTFSIDDIFLFPDFSVDCGENIPLFLALTGMSDRDDKDQWFINDQYKSIGCVMWHQEQGKQFKKYMVEWEDGSTDIRSDFRKATAEEIINHFKRL